MTRETPVQCTDRNIIIDDALKNAVIKNFCHCGIKMESKQLEIALLEISCDVSAHIGNPEPLQFKIIASSDSLSRKIHGHVEKLKKSLDAVDEEQILEQKEWKDAQALEESNLKFENNRKEKFVSFCEGIQNLFPVKDQKSLKYGENSKLFILGDLEDPDWVYKDILTYVLTEIFEKVRDYSEFMASSTYDHFFVKFSNQTMLLDNYVDYYLQQNALPDSELLIELSAAKYEGSESEARIYFDKSGIEKVNEFDRTGQESRIINSQNKRVIRKLMEISKRGQLYLYAEKDEEQKNRVITTLVEANPDKDTGLYIKFSGFMSWSVIRNGREELVYHHGKYWLNRSKKDKLYLGDIKLVKKELNKKANKNPQLKQQLDAWLQTEQLEKLVEILEEQKHGTIVIVTDDEDETKRLCRLNRGTLLNVDKDMCAESIEPIVWNKEQLLSMTGIDGALFVNLRGQCLAMGVLMDGVAIKPGDVGRGARYNSTVNYVTQKTEKIYIGIVVSEDGMINVICN